MDADRILSYGNYLFTAMYGRSHRVAIVYTTDTLTLPGSAGEYLLLAKGDQLRRAREQQVPAFLLKLQLQLSLSGYALRGLLQ